MGDHRGISLLDGATGTELARRGVNTNTPIWSAAAIVEAPLVLRAIHEDYLRAGADAITTNTFRTHERSLAKVGMGREAAALTRAAMRIACEARDAVRPDALVLGSVAPLEDCYHPELAPSPEICFREHLQQIRRLLDAGVDRILIETMNIQHEALAAAEAAQQIAPGAWMISFCTRSDEGTPESAPGADETPSPPGVLLSGQPLVDLLPQLSCAAAIGINCVAAPAVAAQVQLLRKLLPFDMPIMAYANVGYCAPDHMTWIDSDAVSPAQYADYAEQWVESGASIIGGCCGTTPETIAAIVSRIESQAMRR